MRDFHESPATAGAMKKAFIACPARKSRLGVAEISPLMICSA